MNSSRETIVWWETRRIPYNVMLLLLGICTIVIVEIVGSRYANPGEDVEEPLGIIFGAVVYGVAANACYTLGWITELIRGRVDADPMRMRFRKKLFWVGMVSSACLTLLPAFLLPLLWALFGFQHGSR